MTQKWVMLLAKIPTIHRDWEEEESHHVRLTINGAAEQGKESKEFKPFQGQHRKSETVGAQLRFNLLEYKDRFCLSRQ
jgi:hypothetical protein